MNGPAPSRRLSRRGVPGAGLAGGVWDPPATAVLLGPPPPTRPNAAVDLTDLPPCPPTVRIPTLRCSAAPLLRAYPWLPPRVPELGEAPARVRGREPRQSWAGAGGLRD